MPVQGLYSISDPDIKTAQSPLTSFVCPQSSVSDVCSTFGPRVIDSTNVHEEAQEIVSADIEFFFSL